MRKTGYENLIWQMSSIYGHGLCFQNWHRKSPKQAKNEIIEGNCKFSACYSGYHEIFVSCRGTELKTVSVTAKS